MDLQVLLMVCGVGVAGAAVLLLMGLFSTSGTSYEEAIAQQRKATTELLALVDNKNKNKKNSKKANKKLAKKEKGKDNTATTASDPESETYAESGADEEPAPSNKPHVDFSPSVVVDEPKDTPSNLKVPEKKEDVIEKKEVKPVKQAKPAKSSPKITAPAPDQDEGSRERRNSGDAPKEQRKAAKKTEKRSITEDIVDSPLEAVPTLAAIQPSELTTAKLLKQAPAAAPVAPVPSLPAKNKKKKNETATIASVIAAGESGVLNVNELVRVVREASLSRNDIQILTDVLLNMHHDLLPEHSEWSEGPNDPMQKLKKQLADKEKALADEIEASQAIHAKLKELRGVVNAERARAAAAARAAEAAAAAARAEAHTQAARLTRLLDEHRALQQDNLVLQSKLAAEAESQTQRVQMEMHIQRLSESEAALLQQLNAQQAELNARVLELNQARCELGTVRDSMMQHASEYTQQLQESQRALSELEAARAAATLAEQRAAHDLRLARDRLHELQNEVQRLTGRAQAAEADADKYKQEAEQLKQQAEQLTQQLTSESSQLQEQVASREAELAELRALKAAPAHNGLPASNDAFKAAELAKVESVVESLRSELGAAQQDCRDQRAHIQHLADQLAATRDKNNELRTKNWKVMEALKSTEKALQTRIAIPAQESLTEALAKAQEAQYKEIAAVLRGACPAAAPGSTPDRAWLDAFASNLKSELNKTQVKEILKIEKVTDDKRVEELQAQNEHLQALVNKYKIIIDDTEGLLGRLQGEAASVEDKWQAQLDDKQRELDQLRRNTEQMQGKINELKEELQKVKSSSHNHSFADAERITQEKILAGLSGKKNADIRNGPSQVGLEEK